MKPYLFLLVVFAFACGQPTQQDENLPDENNPAVQDSLTPVKADSHEQLMTRIDEYVGDLEHTGGFTGTSKRIGTVPKFIDFIAYFVDGSIVKLETYLFEGSNKRTSERLYFKDKRIVRYDSYERQLDDAAARVTREEMHYFDGSEKLVRSIFREDMATSGGFPSLAGIELSPLVDQDIQVKGKVITGKMMSYTNEMATADEADLNKLKARWPEGNWDMEQIKSEVLEERSSPTE